MYQTWWERQINGARPAWTPSIGSSVQTLVGQADLVLPTGGNLEEQKDGDFKRHSGKRGFVAGEDCMSVHILMFFFCDSKQIITSLVLIVYEEAVHCSLTSVAPDISQQETGGEHGQEKVGQSDERVQDPR